MKLVKPYCGICGCKRVLPRCYALDDDLRCPNTSCDACAVQLCINDGWYDTLLKLNALEDNL